MVSIRNATPLTLQIMAQVRVAVINTGEQETVWSHGVLVAAFGKEKYSSHPNAEQINKGKGILFYLPDHTCEVLYNNTVTSEP